MVIGWRKLYSGLESRYFWRFHAGSIGNLLLLVTFRKTLTCFGQWGISKATPISILQFLSVCLTCLGSSVLSWCSLLKVSIGTRNICPCLFSPLTPLTSFLSVVLGFYVYILHFIFLTSILLPLVLLRKWHHQPQPHPLHEQSLRKLANGHCQSCQVALTNFLSRSLSEGKTLLLLSWGNI